MKRLIVLMMTVMLFMLMPLGAEAASDKLIALTYDDGPHEEYTEQLLDGLKERGVKVTFFTIGHKADSHPELVQRAYDEGHEIGNHSWDHPYLTTLSLDEVKEQIDMTQDVLDEICGEGTQYLMRPPYGDVNSEVASVVGMPVIKWSIDSSDWATEYDYVYNFIMKTAKKGCIILCHDTVAHTVPATLDAIDDLLAQGYEFVTVTEMFRRYGVEPKDGEIYFNFYNRTVQNLDPVLAPVISCKPEGSDVRVTISSPSGAPVYYSTDGSRLNQQSEIYTESFLVPHGTEIRAVAAYNLNGDRSEEASLYIEPLPCPTPEIEVINGWMSLSCEEFLEPIYYTLDGSRPTASSPCYTEEVELAPGTLIRVIAGGDEFGFSQELTMYYSENGNLFADVLPGKWYTDTMDQMASTGLMIGLGGYRYEPNGSLTRAMVVELLFRYDGQEQSDDWKKTNTFTDVRDGKWYAQSVEWAYANDIVEGYPEGDFRPDQPVTRQEMAEMICGFMAYQGTPLPEGADCREQFADGDQISRWALNSVNAVVGAKLMQGDPDGHLTPLDTATRAEFATILLRLEAYEQ